MDIQNLDLLKSKLDKEAVNTTSSLQTDTGEQLPLKSVHVRARLVDMTAKVTIYQEYENTEQTKNIEAKYLFPLNDQATVCGFEAFINDKHVIGVCKEKQQAHREYREAIEQGKGAYLIDQESNELFKVNIGNLPPKCRCIIKITYVAELDVQNEEIHFKLPGNVTSWQMLHADKEVLQESVLTRFINKLSNPNNVSSKVNNSFEASIVMPFEIRSIKSPTHKFHIKKTQTQAVCQLINNPKQSEDNTLILIVNIATIHMPRMFVEDFCDEKTGEETRACMVSFYPEFECQSAAASQSALESTQFCFLIDCSNSMLENNLVYMAKKLAFLILKSLKVNTVKFNLILFGTDFVELFPFG